MRGQKVKVDEAAVGGAATEGGSTTGTKPAAEGEGGGGGGGELAPKQKEGIRDLLTTTLPYCTIVYDVTIRHVY
jgi:hypothetical protein